MFEKQNWQKINQVLDRKTAKMIKDVLEYEKYLPQQIATVEKKKRSFLKFFQAT